MEVLDVKTISLHELGQLVVELAIKHNKTPEDIRGILTKDSLASMGYTVEQSAVPLGNLLQQARVQIGEDLVVAYLKEKGFV